jgi:hypothetical protein
MKYILAAVGLAALVSTTSFGTEPQDKPQGPSPAVNQQGKSDVPNNVVRLPARISAICEKAKGDTLTVCAEYEALFARVEREKVEQARRLEELTRGGVVDTLR